MKSLLENHFTGLMITLWIIYIIPILIASYRKCNHINGIALVNILLGTSILGWVGALVWAVSDKKETFKLPKHRIWVYISVIFMVIGTIGSIFIYKNMYNKPHADIENTMPAYSLNAQELWKQYNQELKLADSLYTGKVIEITGNLSKIDKVDSLVYLVFVMEPDPDFGDKTIRCEMLPKYNEEASKAIVNAPLKVKGFCSGYDQTDIKFSKCSIIK